MLCMIIIRKCYMVSGSFMGEYLCEKLVEKNCLATLERVRIGCIRILVVVSIWAVVMIIETTTGRCGRQYELVVETSTGPVHPTKKSQTQRVCLSGMLLLYELWNSDMLWFIFNMVFKQGSCSGSGSGGQDGLG